TQYTAPIAVTHSLTIKAIATASGMSDSEVATAAYAIVVPTATPTFTPAAGTYVTSVAVTLSDATSGASIFYTTDGSTPTAASTRYTAPIVVTQTTTLKAMATASGMADSGVASAAYTIILPAPPPTFAPAAGIYISSVTVTLGDTASGASIF